MKRSKGFTLIELLVVIAIIALLLSIVMPALRKAKAVAWEVMCRNNLRQYGIAGSMYTQEFNSLFPNAWGSIFRSVDPDRLCQWHDRTRNPLVRPDLAGSLWPYLGSQDKSHLCPVFDLFARRFHEHTNTIPIEPIFGYSMNAFLGGFELAGPTQYRHVLRVQTTSIRSPATIFFFAEENPWVNNTRYQSTLNDNALCGAPQHPSNASAWSNYPLTWNPVTHGGTLLDSLATFHKTTFDKRDDGESNVVFVDGHVELANWKDSYRLARWTNTMPPLQN
jgi:prepilin-type N-terminal cleavage/methylation domain-containing protein/prepilin-type processing-associated H-X9-DG protein